jgi:predicted nucleotidyltransferase component of viral defense system
VKNLYPTSFAETARWAAETGLPVGEARFRFAQYGVLRAVASSKVLSETLVFKGGNALDFVWQPNRSTRDLDFSARESDLGAGRIRELLTASLARAGRETGVAYRVQRVRQNPPGENKTFITYDVKIGYALPDDLRSRQKIEHSEDVSAVVPVEISLNEPICASVGVDIDAAHPLEVSTLEDIVAEKLRALLQQPIRNRSRRQDMLDIAVILRGGEDLDRAKVAEYLIRKAAARSVPVSREAFRGQEIKARAAEGYEELEATTRYTFISFAEAYAEVMALVDRLNLPEQR